MEAAGPRLLPSVLPWPIFGWEYHEEHLAHAKPWGTKLNRLGLEGWDLVSVLHDESSSRDEGTGYQARVLFRRPRADLPNDEELRALGFKNPEVFTTWLEEAREQYLALVRGPLAEAQGRVVRGRPDDEEE